ncbi:MAG: SDR family oxidoreductase [Nitrososphaeraceae archaeon]|nr:SDR family oxidoreductase [Nitrososphaeraceae archaeon]MDW0142155.1 SDR family oxidoreductase [Nitrososphaeraceae archaeon]MDW0145476.1 SDR family oxidoreductase [Nitrososphaeraceae archaeon]MDW0147980.1 SDR family oxidoreductase [Nitrososphaeraceae archaeon]
MDDSKFADKVVVVTGSGTGIGQAIAKRFAENGATIILLGRRKEPLEQTRAELEKIVASTGSKGKIRIFPGVDVSDETAITNMFSTISKEIGPVDILVNNAGVSGPVKLFTNSNFAEFKECVMIHLTGTFWTTLKSIENMRKDSKVITISTFFTEENKYEQRPYRFRTPYTSAQGAKNRLAEAFAWELVPYGIQSIATNPGPVHSDRIYKTVYPKAAAEFLRIGGFPGLSSIEIEKILQRLLNILGEDQTVIDKEMDMILQDVFSDRIKTQDNKTKLTSTLRELLSKTQEIAEKIQLNTKKMIVDKEFLSQDQVAEMVLNLSSEKMSKLLNGRVIPNDRVFYPTRPIIGTYIHQKDMDISDKVIVLIINSSAEKDLKRAKIIANSLVNKIKQLVILTKDSKDLSYYKEYHSHSVNLSNEDAVKGIFRVISEKFSAIDAVVLLTGEHDYDVALRSLDRKQWDHLVEDYLFVPAMITRESVTHMAPAGAVSEPSLFKGSSGSIIIVGPDSPVGDKISGVVRARSEIFRGALRPFNATVNQELRDVIKSNIRQYLLLAGNIEGHEPDEEKITNMILNIIAQSSGGNNQTIFYVDES